MTRIVNSEEETNYLFLSICIEAVLVCINIITSSQIWWSILTGMALAYFFFVLRYAILGKGSPAVAAKFLFWH